MKIALSVIAIVFASVTEANAADRPFLADVPAVPTTGVEQARNCPTRDAVAAALSPALAHLRPGIDPLPSDLRIVDLGDAFEVATGGQRQRYADAARDCAERARVAAVFVALVMNPPLLEPPRPPPPVAPPVSLPQAQPPPVAKRTWVSVGLAARFDSAAGGGDSATDGAAAGGELEVAAGRGSIGIEAAAGAMTSTENAIGAVRVSQRRFPCSLSAAIHRRAGQYLEVGADLGASLTPFTLHGQGLDTTLPVTRFDAGARVALELSVAGRALAPFASLHLEYFPRSYEIAVAPLGNIGATAPIQIGLSLGLAFQARR